MTKTLNLFYIFKLFKNSSAICYADGKPNKKKFKYLRFEHNFLQGKLKPVINLSFYFIQIKYCDSLFFCLLYLNPEVVHLYRTRDKKLFLSVSINQW